MKPIICAATLLVATVSPALADDAAVDAIMQADRDFAAMAAEAGPEAAFAQWPEGALLHWEPREGFASQAGDFGVTWGVWSLHPDGDQASAPAGRGTYITVWGQDDEGNWRGLLDMGTDDPSYRPGPPEADSQSAPEDD
ncbi:MAG: hypothetical protein U9P68_10455 [Pseudomonadota bacterium]|nr:hypothetical protein [Pseudomonadota bacterium]